MSVELPFHMVNMGTKQVKFAQQLNPKYLCYICNKLLKEPIQTTDGDLACHDCYMDRNRLERDSTTSSVFPDKSVTREINKLECLCSNEKYNCKWKGALVDINAHENICEFNPATCENCGKEVLATELEHHKENDCQQRRINCSYCGKGYKAVGDERLKHEQTCEKRPIHCPFKCGVEIKQDEVFHHLTICQTILAGKTCPYSIMGCDKFHDDQSLSDHMVQEAMHHSGIVIEKFVYMERDHYGLSEDREQLRETIQSCIKEIDELKETLSGTVSQLISLRAEKNQLEEVDQKIVKLEDEIKEFSSKDEQIQDLCKVQEQVNEVMKDRHIRNELREREDYHKIEADIKKCHDHIDQLETNQALSSSNLADVELKLQLLESTSYTGKQIWRIENVRYRMKQSENGRMTALHSPPCFTNRFGYKFCTRLYLNGDGMGKGSHLSIFFVVMKSQYDNLLKWPFVRRVTFRLLNHEDIKRTRRETFLTDKTSSSFQKPTKEMNVAAGCPMYIEKSQLDNGFVLDDCLFVETTVEDEQRSS